jgi:hypothetical protein
MPLLRAASLLLPHLVEKLGENEAPAVMGTYLFPRMADELSTVNHSKMTDAIENERLQDLSTLVARNDKRIHGKTLPTCAKSPWQSHTTYWKI